MAAIGQTQASQGRLPKQSMQQITPPMAVVRNLFPKLPIAPTIVVPPEIKLQQPNMPDLGDPMSHLPSVPSNGTGAGGGIGSGSGGGVGSGEGPDMAPVAAAAPVAEFFTWVVAFLLRK